MKKIKQIEEYVCDLCNRGMEPPKSYGSRLRSIVVNVPYTGGIKGEDFCEECNRIILNAISQCEQKGIDDE